MCVCIKDLADGILPCAPLSEELDGKLHAVVLERPEWLEVGDDSERLEPGDVARLHQLQMGHLVSQVTVLPRATRHAFLLGELERIEHVRQCLVTYCMALDERAERDRQSVSQSQGRWCHPYVDLEPSFVQGGDDPGEVGAREILDAPVLRSCCLTAGAVAIVEVGCQQKGASE